MVEEITDSSKNGQKLPGSVCGAKPQESGYTTSVSLKSYLLVDFRQGVINSFLYVDSNNSSLFQVAEAQPRFLLCGSLEYPGGGVRQGLTTFEINYLDFFWFLFCKCFS